jgi:hypothetical protein
LAAAALAFGYASEARGEYAENYMGRDFAGITLGAAGSVALGFSIASTVYLAGGPGDEVGRIVTGVGAIHAGTGLMLGGALALSVIGEDHVPAGVEDSPEAEALTVARALAGIDIGLALVSAGLGIASVATYERSEEAPTTGAVSWQLAPVVYGDSGGRIGATGRF